jgi:SUF system NifU family Fe-S assembly protein
MASFIESLLLIGAGTLALAMGLTLLPWLPRVGQKFVDRLSYAPAVDVVIALLTVAPWLTGGLIWGWIGVAGALVGQVAALYLWIIIHELIHRQAARGPRLVRVHHRLVGRLRNQLSLGLTVVGVPVLWAVRLPEIFGYPLLVWLLGFPRYRHREWVSLTRHKFQDLVGHDLVWCLYCDWMTGTWSLGSEMLRNIESFWCPIRFADEKKNEHARIDFPDVASDWVPIDGTMADAAALLERKHGGAHRSWFGHPERDEAADERWEDLPRQILTEHGLHPRNCRTMAESTHHAEGHTPVCNDHVSVYLRVEEGRIADISFTAQACALCTASASMMTEHLRGQNPQEARRLYERFHSAILRPGGAGELAGDLAVIAEIHRFPSRIKCATLPWHTMNAALNGRSGGEAPEGRAG